MPQLRLWQGAQGQMTMVIGAAILATSVTSVLLIGSLAITRTEQVLAQTGDLFLQLGAHSGSDVPSSIAALSGAGLRVEARVPPEFDGWPWYRPISVEQLNQDLARVHPGSQAQLTTHLGNVTLWVHASDVLGNRWIGFPVAADYLQLGTRFVLWLAVMIVLIMVMASYVVRQINRPLEELAEAAALLGRGVELPRWTPKGSIEIRRLGQELYQAAEAVRRSVRDREFLFAGISHDLRTPLARMRLALDFIDTRDPAQRDLVDGLVQDIGEMDALVRRFVEQLRDGTDERPTTVDLNAVVADVAQAYRSYGQPINVFCHAQRTVEILPLAFRRLLRNLIQNAIDHGAAPIEIEAWTTASEAFVSVRDHGKGLSEKRLAVLRRRARRAPFRSARGGRGLGLRIAERIAESHGGQLRYSPAMPGLRIELRLPLPRARRWS